MHNSDDSPLHCRADTGTQIILTNLTFHTPKGADVLAAATVRYHAIILRDPSNHQPHGDTNTNANTNANTFDYPVTFAISELDAPLSPGVTDESYKITCGTAGAEIAAPTQWGALKALETFSQLIYARGNGQHALPAPPIKIRDRPRFGYEVDLAVAVVSIRLSNASTSAVFLAAPRITFLFFKKTFPCRSFLNR